MKIKKILRQKYKLKKKTEPDGLLIKLIRGLEDIKEGRIREWKK